jgi:site-specific recombinase XerD
MASSERLPLTSTLPPGGMVEAVLAHAESTGDLAASTLAEFSDVMRRFAVFVERGLGATEVSAIGEAEVRAFIQSRRADGAEPSLSLMHNRRTICRYLFRTARSLGLCASDPTAAVELPPRTQAGPRPLTDEEVRLSRSYALFHPADLHHPVAWALAEATARTHEIARVLVRDVAIDPGTVYLRGSPRSDARTVDFTEWGLVQVRRRLDLRGTSPEDPLVPFRSRRVPRASASMAVIEVLKRAGIKALDVRPISVVAWRGAKAYEAGASIEEVAALLGMRSLDRTAALIAVERGLRAP